MTKDYPVLEWTPDMVRRFWDWQSGMPEAYFTYRHGANISAFISQYVTPGTQVLDYGCGVGHLLPHLCAIGCDVYGLDLSPQSVQAANSRCNGMTNFRGAFLADDPARAEDRFDLIVSVEVIEHLYDDVLVSMLADVRMRLKPGGVAVFTTPNDEDLSSNMILNPETGRLFHRWQHVRSWSSASLAPVIREAGFEVADMIETNLTKFRRPGLVLAAKALLRDVLYPQPALPHLVCLARCPLEK